MPELPYHRLRLEPAPRSDWDDAVSVAVHDPLWFLARQWQLGELQGENATTPVRVEVFTDERVIASASGVDPAAVPAEAIVESELGDWWTVGRRIRLGRIAATWAAANGVPLPVDGARMRDLAPPFADFDGAWDGQALAALPAFAAALSGRIPDAPETVPAWDAQAFRYTASDAFSAAGVSFDVVRHPGGRVDWYTVDARQDGGPAQPDPVSHVRIPARVSFPGMPLGGVWEIEDAQTDLGAIAPDSSHTPTAVLTELLSGHRPEWFTVPVPGRAGTILSITRVTVEDDFGNLFDSDDVDLGAPRWIGLQPPASAARMGTVPWTLFQTAGLDPQDLVLWHVAELPLVGEAIERVQFGVDDASNVVWAVERRLRGRDAAQIAPPSADSVEPVNPSTPKGDVSAPLSYAYVPGVGAAPHWIPYTLDDADDAVAHVFVQRRLVDLSVRPPMPMPLPDAEVLRTAGGVHRVDASAIPPSGVEVERRAQLARDTHGRPVLWIQRQRRPLLSPPARRLAFDVAEPLGEGSG